MQAADASCKRKFREQPVPASFSMPLSDRVSCDRVESIPKFSMAESTAKDYLRGSALCGLPSIGCSPRVLLHCCCASSRAGFSCSGLPRDRSSKRSAIAACNRVRSPQQTSRVAVLEKTLLWCHHEGTSPTRRHAIKQSSLSLSLSLSLSTSASLASLTLVLSLVKPPGSSGRRPRRAAAGAGTGRTGAGRRTSATAGEQQLAA